MKLVFKKGSYEKDGVKKECLNLVLRDETIGDIPLKCAFSSDYRLVNRLADKHPEFIVEK